MPIGNTEAYVAKNISASTLIKTGQGVLGGVFVSSASGSPTLKIYDGTDNTGTVLINTVTPVAATWLRLPVAFGTGLYVEIGATTSLSVLYI